MTRWTDFIKEWAKKNGTTYKEAMSSPEVKDEYRKMYPKTQSAETDEYQKIKSQTVKYERDQTQKELSDISKFQKLKDRTVSYQRDEAQKDLMGIAKSAAQKEKQKSYEVYKFIVPKMYELRHKYKLIKANAGQIKKVKPLLKRFQKYLDEIISLVESKTKTTNYITREEFDKIQQIEPIEVGIFGEDTEITPYLFEVLNTLIEDAKAIWKQLR
jgi:hypothetical protein